MSELGLDVVRAGVRLRRAERHQVEMVVARVDDLVALDHPVRQVLAVVEKLDLSGFYEPIQAREHQAGCDATDPALLVALWERSAVEESAIRARK